MPEPAITLAAGLPPLPLVGAAALLCFLPGYAAAGLLLPTPRYRGVERLLAAPALTLAALALLTLWASTLRIPLGSPAAWLMLGASLGWLACSWLSAPSRVAPASVARGLVPRRAAATTATAVIAADQARLAPRQQASARSAPLALEEQPGPGKQRARFTLPAEALVAAGYVGLFAVALGLRLWSVRDLLPTLGADTYHHTLIAALIVERGGLPDSYAPYAPIQSFAYHFGFHNLVAWLHWWTGADVGTLVGLAGHLVNVAVALSVAFLALRVLGDGLVAALAAWLVALLCVFPAFLLNWGRYTQAAGLVLLPVAAALCIDALGPGRRPAPAVRAALAAGLAASGLLLAHYRMAAMLALLVAVWLVYLLTTMAWEHRRGRQVTREPDGETAAIASPGPPFTAAMSRPAAATFLALGGTAVVALLLALPWLLRLAGGLSLGLGQQPGDYGADYYGLERLGTAVSQLTNFPLLALAALGLAIACRPRRRPASGRGAPALALAESSGGQLIPERATAVLALAAWAVAQLALANPRWWPIPMPLAGRVDLITTIAALCFPVAVAAALALAVAARSATRRWGDRGLAMALTLGAGATALGGWQLQALVTPNNALVAPADLAAAAWLRAHSPSDARVAVSAMIVPWAPDYVVGIDGGYWLPLLASRATTVLPMLYPGERGADPQAVARMVAVTRALRDAPADPATAALLRSQGVGYVYHSGRSPVPALEGLAANPALRLVYDQGGVRIWAVVAG
ncbi:MAG TPA: DUF6541 family protein [Chloroflexota bacterium]|nr:DUF6541 family protein [Chloroflexota bacterium]